MLISQTFQIPSQVSQKTQVVLLHHSGSLGQFNGPAKVKGRFYSKRMCN